MPAARRRTPLDEYVLPLVRYRTRAGVVTVAAIVLVGGLVAVAFDAGRAADPSLPLGLPWLPWTLPIAAAACLLVKRRLPAWSAGGTAVLLLLDVAAITGGLSLVLVVALFDAVYAAMLDPRPRIRGLVVAIVIAAGVALLGVWLGQSAGAVDPAEGVALVVAVAMLGGAPAVLGTSVRQRDELLEAETERADAVARAADAERDRAVRDERAAMARELHDEIAARLSAIALQSAALSARVPAADEAAAASIRAMRSSSVEALEELRQLIEVLTTGREDDAVAVGIDDADALQRDAERFGLALEADVDVPPGSVGTAASHALMRIARESLANAARHAPGASVRLRARVEGDAATLHVENALVPDAREAEGNGLGTAIMAQRWRAVGGSGSAGRTDDGRWIVHATVPRQETSG
ncbi:MULTISPECIES: sensor histidine kinase [unclassified Agrococcus]|uniref:sensor histidine kinase n=1 Tax=unclassified Agrococcus TaxID=2615065 RepID=UPI0036089D44